MAASISAYVVPSRIVSCRCSRISVGDVSSKTARFTTLSNTVANCPGGAGNISYCTMSSSHCRSCDENAPTSAFTNGLPRDMSIAKASLRWSDGGSNSNTISLHASYPFLVVLNARTIFCGLSRVIDARTAYRSVLLRLVAANIVSVTTHASLAACSISLEYSGRIKVIKLKTEFPVRPVRSVARAKRLRLCHNTRNEQGICCCRRHVCVHVTGSSRALKLSLLPFRGSLSLRSGYHVNRASSYVYVLIAEALFCVEELKQHGYSYRFPGCRSPSDPISHIPAGPLFGGVKRETLSHK